MDEKTAICLESFTCYHVHSSYENLVHGVDLLVQIAVVFRVSKDHFYRVKFFKKLVYVKLCCLLKIYVAGD